MAENPNRLAGTAYVSADGRRYALVGELTYGVSKLERETLPGQDGIHGFKEKPVAGFISGSFRDSSSVSVAEINAMADATVVAELNNGKTIVGRNMWTVGPHDVATEEGSFAIRWESADVTEN